MTASRVSRTHGAHTCACAGEGGVIALMFALDGRSDSSKTIAAWWDVVVNAANTIMSTRAAHRAGDPAVRTQTWGSADCRTLRPFPRAQSAAAVTRWLAAPKPPKTATAEARHPSYQPLPVPLPPLPPLTCHGGEALSARTSFTSS